MKKYTATALIIVFAASISLSARADITTGLVGNWDLNDGPGHSNVVDSSGSGNTGTLTGFTDTTFTNMWTTNVDPSNGGPYAITFNTGGVGTATYITVPDSTTLDSPAVNKTWSVAAWVNCAVAGASEPNNVAILSKGANGDEEYDLYMSGGKFTGSFHNAADSGGTSGSSVTIPAANTWYHVVATVHVPKVGNSEVFIYVNGVEEYGTNSNTYTTMYTNNSALTIGCHSAGTLPFQGIIDGVRVYNRELSSSDVLQLYQLGPVNSGVGYWNGLAGSGGNASLDSTSLNFSTNFFSAPVGAPDTLPDVLNVEFNSTPSEPNAIYFLDSYYNNRGLVAVQNTNLTTAAGGVAVGNANGAGTIYFDNTLVTYILNSSDANGLKDGVNPTALVENGSGTVVVTGNNTFSGGATINSGILQIGNGGATPATPLGSATTLTDNGSLVFLGNDSPTFGTSITGTGTVTQAGPGTLTLGNTGSTFSGGVAVTNNGTISTSSMNDSSSPVGTGPLNLNGGTILYTSSVNETTVRGFNGASGTVNTINVPSGITLETTGRVTGAAAWVVNKNGPGTLTLSGTGDNSFLGVNLNAGTLILNKTSGTGHAVGNPLNVASGATVQLNGAGYAAEIYDNAAAPVTIASGGVFDAAGESITFYSLSLAGSGLSGSGALTNSFSGPSTLTCQVILAANATIGGLGGITLPGSITGPGSLTYSASGAILTLQGYNTYTGGTFVNAGEIDANVPDSIPGNLTVSSGATLQLDSPYAMSPTAALTLPATANSAILNFSGAQTVAALVVGGTPMPAGLYGANNINPSGVFSASGSGVINVMAPYWDANHTDAGSSSSANGGGSGSWDSLTSDWWVSGAADTTWAANNEAYFGGIAGTVTLNAPESVLGLDFLTAGYSITNTDGTSALTLTGNNPIISVPTGTTAIGCMINGGGTATGLTASGPGTLILAGNNTYANGTLITNGATLSVNAIADSGTSAISTGNVIVYGGALSYTGSAPATTTRSLTGINPNPNGIDVAAGSGGLTINGAVTGTNWAKTSSGILSLGGAVDNPSLGMNIDAGTVIITKSSATNIHGLGGASSSVASGAELQLAGTGGYDLYSGCILTVNNGGVLDVNSQSDSFSTFTLSGVGAGSGALINSSTSATSALTNAGSGVVLAANTTVGGPGNITLASTVSGSSALTYAGAGTLALAGANTFSGGITINSGTVLLTNTATAGGAGSIADNATLGVGITGNNVILPNAIIGAGVVNILETVNDNLQLGGSMSGFTGTLNCPASASTAKLQILTTGVAINSLATINVAAGGTFYVENTGVNIPCPVNLFGVGNSEVYGALRLENNAMVSGPVILHGSTTMGNNQTGPTKAATISGPISQTGGSFGIAFGNIGGTIILSGSNSFTGGMIISNGEVMIGASGCLGATPTATNYAGNITNNSAFVYNSSAAQTLSGTISGTGLFGQAGPGTLTLTGTNNYAGNTSISNATLAIAGGGCLGVTATATNYAGAITNAGALNYASSATQTLSGLILGSGTVTQSGGGKLILTDGDTYSGATTVSSGTLAIGSGGSINSSASINISAGATFDLSAYTSYTIPSVTAVTANGTGIGVGLTAATIVGGPGTSPVTIEGPVTLTYTPASFTGDATHPALYVSQGDLTFSASSLTVNNAGGSPLGVGTYSVIQVASAGILNAVSSVTVTGAGLAAGATASLSVSGNSINLVVSGSSKPPTAVITRAVLQGGNLVFNGTNGTSSGNYYVLTSTNLTLPLNQWTVIATNSFSGAGTFSVTNTVNKSPSYFIIATP